MNTVTKWPSLIAKNGKWLIRLAFELNLWTRESITCAKVKFIRGKLRILLLQKWFNRWQNNNDYQTLRLDGKTSELKSWGCTRWPNPICRLFCPTLNDDVCRLFSVFWRLSDHGSSSLSLFLDLFMMKEILQLTNR